MTDELRKLKDEATKLLEKGRGTEAAEVLVKILREDAGDLATRQRLAELYVRLGRRGDAIAEYQTVAGAYAAEGLLLKAIAVCKVILQLDPEHRETQSILADLTTKRQSGAAARQMPASMAGAVRRATRYDPPDLKRTAEAEQKAKARAMVAAATAFARPQLIKPEDPIAVAVRAAALASLKKAKGAAPVAPAQAAATPETRAPSSPAPAAPATSAGPAAAAPAAAGGAPPAPPAPFAPAGVTAPEAPEENVRLAAGHGEPPPARGAPVLVTPPAPTAARPPSPPPMPAPPVPVPPPVAPPSPAAAGAVELSDLPPIPLFSELPREAFIALTERMALRSAARNELLIREGDTGSSMFIVIQGRVTVSRAALDGSGDVVLAELEDGAFFGEIALIADTPRMATVRCAEETLLFEVKRDVIDAIADDHPSVTVAMNRFFKSRLLASLMSTSPIFAPFDLQERKALLEKFKLRSADKGEALLTQAARGDGLYLLLSGRCDVIDRDSEGRSTSVAELREGDVFGEMSMLWKNNVSASVVTKTPCLVLRLPEESFAELIASHPAVTKNLQDLAGRRQKQNRELLGTPATDFII